LWIGQPHATNGIKSDFGDCHEESIGRPVGRPKNNNHRLATSAASRRLETTGI
jgi:hypothetical protein